MLNAFTLPDDVALCRSPTRAEILKILVSEFRTAFTGIEYEIDTQTRIVNAQAFGQGGKRFVRIYGGLAFHPLVSEDALAFTLPHETGHHRARGRRFAGDPMIACDCLADKWAVGGRRERAPSWFRASDKPGQCSGQSGRTGRINWGSRRTVSYCSYHSRSQTPALLGKILAQPQIAAERGQCPHTDWTLLLSISNN
jgi:hypothetical protein